MRFRNMTSYLVSGVLLQASSNIYADNASTLLAFEQEAFGYSGTL
ncbi:hypothetical protein [Hahella ganghwensis]|nr:hypothetical protein [Hahella ganghwensis]